MPCLVVFVALRYHNNTKARREEFSSKKFLGKEEAGKNTDTKLQYINILRYLTLLYNQYTKLEIKVIFIYSSFNYREK